MHKIILALPLIVLFSVVGGASAAPPQCSDMVDNDGDGQIDYWKDLPATNGQQITVGGGGDPFQVISVVRQNIVDKKLQITPPTVPLLRTSGGPLHAPDWSVTGVPDLTTAQQVCRILGYSTYVSSTCRDDERSHRYPAGKCNFHSPEDNFLSTFVNTGFANQKATFKYAKTWIASITCKDRLAACNDGWDNDQDGLTDFPSDPGCAALTDDDERPHDTDCSSPDDPSEAPEPTATPTATATPTPTPTPTPTSVSTKTPKPTKTPTPHPTHTPKQTQTPTPTPTPTCQPSPPVGTVVRPMLHCVEPVGTDSFVAFFGYRNDSGRQLKIDIGANNKFIPTPENRGQPTTFEPGKIKDAVGVFFKSSISWLLGGKVVVANSTAPRCGPCTAKRCSQHCRHKDAADGCQRMSDALTKSRDMAMKRLRLYAVSLKGQRGAERRRVKELRSSVSACDDSITLALEELQKHDWLVCGERVCPSLDISKHAQTISDCALTLQKVSDELALRLKTQAGQSELSASAMDSESARTADAVAAALAEIPTVVSTCEN